MTRILFVHNHLASFVRVDRDLLAEKYEVEEWFQHGRSVNAAALAQAVARCDVVVGWFASWHTFAPVMLAKRYSRPTLLLVGGYDTANLPAIGYGNMRGGFKRRISQLTMENATALVTNSNFTRAEVIREVGIAPAKVRTVYHGFAAPPRTLSAKEPLALTIGNVDRGNLRRKGLEPFVRAGVFFPNVPFVVVGAWRDDAIEHLKRIASPNVTFTGWVEAAELAGYVARAQVYVQPSQHEGFGMAVAEAMLAECVPVVTRAGALPEVVGECGVYVESAEPKALAEGIRQGLAADAALGRRARERIIREFPLERRREIFFALIDSLLAGKGQA